MRILADTGVLIRIAIHSDPLHLRLLQCITGHVAAGATIVLAPQCLYEFWVVATRPLGANGFGMAPGEAAKEVRKLVTTFTMLPESNNLFYDWLMLCESLGVTGKPAHDARLAAFALGHRLDAILTLNPTDFTRYRIPVLTP